MIFNLLILTQYRAILRKTEPVLKQLKFSLPRIQIINNPTNTTGLIREIL